MSWSRRKKIPAPTWVLQYRFDAQTGQLSPNTPHRVEQGELVGPRHYIHHPSLDCRLLLERAELQRYRLPGRSRKRRPLVSPDDLDSATVGTSCNIRSSWKWRLFTQN